MAFRLNNVPCYTCNRHYNRRQMTLLYGAENDLKQQIAIDRRANMDGLEEEPVNHETRLCLNCHRSILREIQDIENNPNCMRLNVSKQTSRRTCLFCNRGNDIHRLSLQCRADIFIRQNIFIPTGTRSCNHHLDEYGLVLSFLLPGIQFINRPYLVPGPELVLFLQEIRSIAKGINIWQCYEKDLDDDEFSSVAGLSKEHFTNLYTFCNPVRTENLTERSISKKDLLLFLCKLRHGLSDEFLRVLFKYKSKQHASMAISLVRESLSENFVPHNIGFGAIGRLEYINRHVTDFANQLYNPNPEVPRAIAYVDGTYCPIEKSSNFRVLRQSYCMHKGKHLLKPTLIVAPDGYILDIQGPYFSDSQNNDAAILTREFERDIAGLRAWFENGDIFVVDRGYRDVIPLLNELGIDHRMPCLLARGQQQLTTEEANK